MLEATFQIRDNVEELGTAVIALLLGIALHCSTRGLTDTSENRTGDHHDADGCVGMPRSATQAVLEDPCPNRICSWMIVTFSVPALTTNRLILRAPTEGDFPAYEQLMASPRSQGMGGPYDTRTAWSMFCHDVACWPLFGHGALMADLRTTGECVGQVGINGGPLFPEKELGWFVYEHAEGFGYATEAATALRDWARRTIGLTEIVSYIDRDNLQSIKVAERLGATLDPRRKQGSGDLVFRHPPR